MLMYDLYEVTWAMLKSLTTDVTSDFASPLSLDYVGSWGLPPEEQAVGIADSIPSLRDRVSRNSCA